MQSIQEHPEYMRAQSLIYNLRGIAEQHNKEGKYTCHWTRLSAALKNVVAGLG